MINDIRAIRWAMQEWRKCENLNASETYLVNEFLKCETAEQFNKLAAETFMTMPHAIFGAIKKARNKGILKNWTGFNAQRKTNAETP